MSDGEGRGLLPWMNKEPRAWQLEREHRRMGLALVKIRNTAEHHTDSTLACDAIEGTHCKRDRTKFCELCQRACPWKDDE